MAKNTGKKAPKIDEFHGITGVSPAQAFEVMHNGNAPGLRPDQARAVQATLTRAVKRELNGKFEL